MAKKLSERKSELVCLLRMFYLGPIIRMRRIAELGLLTVGCLRG